MLRRLVTAIATILLVTTGLSAALPAPLVEVAPATTLAAGAPAAHQATATTVESFDGSEIAITVFQPAGSSDTDEVPVVLHGHGWGGSRWTEVDDAAYLLDAGYGVVSIDQRGHGASGGQAHVMHPDYEVRDVQAVIDHVATLDWVQLDEPGDPVLGAIGGSYGGGYQLQTAAFDDRLDALVPEMTWADLPYALAPNGAIKGTWVELLYAAGLAGVDMAPFIHQGLLWGATFNEFPDGQDPGEPDVEGSFYASSPASYPGAITAPTLLVQGMPDMLFNLNQALWNYESIAATGTEVKLVTHLSGHVIHSDGTLPDAPVPLEGGLQPADAGEPCGDLEDLELLWFEEHLKQGADDGLAPVTMALEDGTCVSGPDVTAATLGEASHQRSVPIQGPVVVTQGASAPASGRAEASVQGNGAGADLLAPIQQEVLAPTGETVLVTGVPTLEGLITLGGAEAIVYVSLVEEDIEGDEHIIDSQVVPLRKDGPALQEAFSLELGGIAAEISPGERLLLQVSSTDLMYNGNQERLPGVVVLEDLSISLPVA